MNIDETTLSRINDYLDGEMTESKKIAFEQELDSDKVLRSQVRFVSEIIEGMKDFTLRQELEELWKKGKDLPNDNSTKPSLFSWKIYAIAAAVLVLILVRLIYQETPKVTFSKGEQLAINTSIIDREFESYLGEGEFTEVKSLESLLKNRDSVYSYKKAMKLYQKDSSNLYLNYLLGIAEIYKGEYTQALIHLQRTEQNADLHLSLRAKYWRGMAYACLGHLDEARKIMLEIKNNPQDHYRKESAVYFLREYDRLHTTTD